MRHYFFVLVSALALSLFVSMSMAAEEGVFRLFGWELSDGVDSTIWAAPSGYPVSFAITTDEKSEGLNSKWNDFSSGWAASDLKSGSLSWANIYRYKLIRTSGWHVRTMGSNWSGYRKFWIDIKSTLASATIIVQVEDNLTPHPQSMNRTYLVPAGEWVTLEYDLMAAESLKLLDRSHVASFYILTTRLGNNTKLYIDNFRLAPEGAASQFSIIQDTTAWVMLPDPPGNNNNTTRPEALAALSTTPDISAIPSEEPVNTIIGNGDGGWSNTMHKQDRGCAAFDNEYLVNVSTTPPMSIRVSNNGGSTWSGLIAGTSYTLIASGNNTPNRHGFYCSPTEVLGLYQTLCAGGGSPSDVYFRRIAFNGTSWTAESPVIIDQDVRHCPERFDVIRLPNGRIWATWEHYNRFGRTHIVARFSDDGGHTWQHGGSNGSISVEGSGTHIPMLVSMGQNDVGCIWYKSQIKDYVYFSTFRQQTFDDQYASFLQQNSTDKIPWDRFDTASAWSAPEHLPQGKTLVSALGTLDGRIFAVIGDPSAILVWDGASWTTSLSGQTGQLTCCGDSTLLVFWVSTDKHSIYYRYLQESTWSEPQLAVTDTGSIKTLAIPRTSPVNFVPLNWSYSGENNIRSYRLPLPESIVGIAARTKALPSPLALQTFPSPFHSSVTIAVDRGIWRANKKAAIQLRVYDITGKPVKDFTSEIANRDGRALANTTTVVWNTKNHPSGVYFVKLSCGNKVLTKRISLAK